MMPFIDPRQAAGSIMTIKYGQAQRAPESPEHEAMEEDEAQANPEVQMAAAALLDAIKRGSVDDMALALIEAHEAVDKLEHYEGPHLNEMEGE